MSVFSGEGVPHAELELADYGEVEFEYYSDHISALGETKLELLWRS